MIFVETRRWFTSKAADAMGFLCSEVELDEAERHHLNLIKVVYGVELYLSKKIQSYEREDEG